MFLVTAAKRSPRSAPQGCSNLKEFFGPEGLLARSIPGFVHRPQQVAYATAVAELLHDGGVRMVEGGTGVGKTFGYLVPHILEARRTGGKVLICTRTKNLQDQIFLADLPKLAALFNFKFALLKGRDNYACHQRLEEEWDRNQLFIHGPEHRTMRYLRHFDRLHPTGDLEAAWNFLRRWGPDAWRAMGDVRAVDDVCTSDHRGTCRYYRTLAEAEKADVIVANHHLALLWPESYPKIRYLVLDEAHTLEEAATDVLGPSFSNVFLYGRLRRLNGRPRGTTLGSFNRRDWQEFGVQDADNAISAIRSWIIHFDVSAQAFAALSDIPKRRVTDDMLVHPSWISLCDNAEMLAAIVTTGVAALQKLQKDIGEIERLKPLAERLSRAASGLGEIVAEMNAVFKREPVPSTVLWYKAPPGRSPFFQRSPVAIGPQLAENLYHRFHSVLLTSATLQVGGGFDFLAERLGLTPPQAADLLSDAAQNAAFDEPLADDLDVDHLPTEEDAEPDGADADDIDADRADADGADGSDADRADADDADGSDADIADATDSDAELEDTMIHPPHVLTPVTVGHPFDYPRNVLLCLLREPATGADAITSRLAALATLTHGRMLALFTNKQRMLDVGERLDVPGCEVLVQHRDGSRHDLAQRLRHHPATILLGTRSFWEGIDVPGENLGIVVMEKIPFTSPGEPVYEARCEAMGKKWFPRYALPLALLMLRQGFGRLIRTETDRGIVVILDPGRRSYAGRILATLPECVTVQGNANQVEEAVRTFLAADKM